MKDDRYSNAWTPATYPVEIPRKDSVPVECTPAHFQPTRRLLTAEIADPGWELRLALSLETGTPLGEAP